MMLFGCPVGVRHVHRIIGDQLRRAWHYFQPKSPTRIHFVYFSCARDMELLKLSLKSLGALQTERVGGIFIVVDSKCPFTPGQQWELKLIAPTIEFIFLGRIDWASIDTLQTELRAFAMVAGKIPSADYVAKVDSDVLFFSRDKLDEVGLCGADFVGDGHYSQYAYAQGGLYFLRASLATALFALATEEEVRKACGALNTLAEDRVVSSLVFQQTHRVWLTRLMLFPNEFEKANYTGAWLRQEFLAIHFVHKKYDMPSYAARLMVL